MSDDKVIPLFGGVCIATSQGDKIAVDMLRDALAKAEAGEIVGVGLAYIYRDGAATWRVGGALDSFSIIGAVECMKADLVKIATEEH